MVSVRSAAEARIAVDAGADLIDVKEPSRGPLGPAGIDTIEEVIATVAGRVPVSAAMGEWVDWVPRQLPPGLTYVKWGLASTAAKARSVVRDVRETDYGVAPVLVAYADSQRAGSPTVEQLVGCAADLHFPVFLIDTAVKDNKDLLDWSTAETLARIRHRLAEVGVRVALAGSLDIASIRRLLPIAPDWFAVRGAACAGGREGTVCAERVQQLRAVIATARTPAAAG